MNLKLLKLLQNNNAPLVITLEEKGNQATITRNGITVEEQYQSLKRIREALAYYPEEVWINKEKMETTQWPGLAEVRVTEQDKAGWERNSTPGCNAIVGGVMTWLHLTDQQKKDTRNQYFTPRQDNALRHHVPLQTVTLTAFIEINAWEIEVGEIGNSGGKYLLAIPEGSDMEAAVMARAKEMIERTMDRKELPKPHGGKVYARPMTGPRGAEHFTEPYPIGVMGTPVLLDDDWDAIDNAEFTSIVENLYDIDAKLVPVLEGPTKLRGGIIIPAAGDEALRVEKVTFDIEIDPDCETKAKNISMQVELENDQVFRYPCHFYILGDCEAEAEVKIIPGGINKERLTEILFQAFWVQEEFASWEEAKYERCELNERMRSLAMHVMGETTEAVTREFQRMLDRFYTTVPLPTGEKISVTSQDGRLQLTLNPQAPAALNPQAPGALNP